LSSASAVTGRYAENLACLELVRCGYEIVARNVRCGRGELDIIARHDGALVFVEVKSRRGGVHPAAFAESVSPRKQLLVRRAAFRYLCSHCRTADVQCRFDVVLVVFPGGPGTPSATLIRDAF